MSVIQVLSDDVANKIAAGEVVERPASVVKELVENAVDAGATVIEVEATEGGKHLIRVTDNGSGMSEADAVTGFKRHATSKIRAADDLAHIHTLGFRGEALPSIASVADVQLRTRLHTEDAGVEVSTRGGKSLDTKPAGVPAGTTIIVRDLFFNTPARLKFLKTTATEKRYIADFMMNIAVAHATIRFTLVLDGKRIFTTPGSGDLLQTIAAVHGTDLASELVGLEFENPIAELRGYVGKPSLTRGTRQMMSLFVNGRLIQSRMLFTAVERGYETLLPTRRFPVAFVHATLDPATIDVNVHPAKSEIRFKDEGDVFRAVYAGVKQALLSSDLVPRVSKDAAEIAEAHQRFSDDVQVHGKSGLSPSRQQAFVLPEVPEVSKGSDLSFGSRHNTTYGEEDASSQAEPGTMRSGVWHEVGVKEERPAVRKDVKHWQMPTRSSPSADNIKQVQPIAPRGSDVLRGRLPHLVILGQIDHTYMIAEADRSLWIIDQHVAHERILYERALERIRNQAEVPSQSLLIPVHVTLSPIQVAAIEGHSKRIEKAGFRLEEFGPNTYILRSVPLALRRLGNETELRELVEDLIQLFEDGQEETVNHRLAAMIACKGAVKAGQKLALEEMQKLTRELGSTENPFTCPHGRPIVVEIGLPELERWFYRR